MSSQSGFKIHLCEFVKKLTSDVLVIVDVSLFDSLLYNCVGVYSIPRLEKIYTSSNDGVFSNLILEIIFFFTVSMVSSPYSLSNENSTFILYSLIFSNSVSLNISLKYIYSSSASFSSL